VLEMEQAPTEHAVDVVVVRPETVGLGANRREVSAFGGRGEPDASTVGVASFAPALPPQLPPSAGDGDDASFVLASALPPPLLPSSSGGGGSALEPSAWPAPTAALPLIAGAPSSAAQDVAMATTAALAPSGLLPFIPLRPANPPRPFYPLSSTRSVVPLRTSAGPFSVPRCASLYRCASLAVCGSDADDETVALCVRSFLALPPRALLPPVEAPAAGGGGGGGAESAGYPAVAWHTQHIPVEALQVRVLAPRPPPPPSISLPPLPLLLPASSQPPIGARCTYCGSAGGTARPFSCKDCVFAACAALSAAAPRGSEVPAPAGHTPFDATLAQVAAAVREAEAHRAEPLPAFDIARLLNIELAVAAADCHNETLMRLCIEAAVVHCRVGRDGEGMAALLHLAAKASRVAQLIVDDFEMPVANYDAFEVAVGFVSRAPLVAVRAVASLFESPFAAVTAAFLDPEPLVAAKGALRMFRLLSTFSSMAAARDSTVRPDASLRTLAQAWNVALASALPLPGRLAELLVLPLTQLHDYDAPLARALCDTGGFTALVKAVFALPQGGGSLQALLSLKPFLLLGALATVLLRGGEPVARCVWGVVAEASLSNVGQVRDSLLARGRTGRARVELLASCFLLHPAAVPAINAAEMASLLLHVAFRNSPGPTRSLCTFSAGGLLLLLGGAMHNDLSAWRMGKERARAELTAAFPLEAQQALVTSCLADPQCLGVCAAFAMYSQFPAVREAAGNAADLLGAEPLTASLCALAGGGFGAMRRERVLAAASSLLQGARAQGAIRSVKDARGADDAVALVAALLAERAVDGSPAGAQLSALVESALRLASEKGVWLILGVLCKLPQPCVFRLQLYPAVAAALRERLPSFTSPVLIAAGVGALEYLDMWFTFRPRVNEFGRLRSPFGEVELPRDSMKVSGCWAPYVSYLRDASQRDALSPSGDSMRFTDEQWGWSGFASEAPLVLLSALGADGSIDARHFGVLRQLRREAPPLFLSAARLGLPELLQGLLAIDAQQRLPCDALYLLSDCVSVGAAVEKRAAVVPPLLGYCEKAAMAVRGEVVRAALAALAPSLSEKHGVCASRCVEAVAAGLAAVFGEPGAWKDARECLHTVLPSDEISRAEALSTSLATLVATVHAALEANPREVPPHVSSFTLLVDPPLRPERVSPDQARIFLSTAPLADMPTLVESLLSYTPTPHKERLQVALFAATTALGELGYDEARALDADGVSAMRAAIARPPAFLSLALSSCLRQLFTLESGASFVPLDVSSSVLSCVGVVLSLSRRVQSPDLQALAGSTATSMVRLLCNAPRAAPPTGLSPQQLDALNVGVLAELCSSVRADGNSLRRDATSRERLVTLLRVSIALLKSDSAAAEHLSARVFNLMCDRSECPAVVAAAASALCARIATCGAEKLRTAALEAVMARCPGDADPREMLEDDLIDAALVFDRSGAARFDVCHIADAFVPPVVIPPSVLDVEEREGPEGLLRVAGRTDIRGAEAKAALKRAAALLNGKVVIDFPEDALGAAAACAVLARTPGNRRRGLRYDADSLCAAATALSVVACSPRGAVRVGAALQVAVDQQTPLSVVRGPLPWTFIDLTLPEDDLPDDTLCSLLHLGCTLASSFAPSFTAGEEVELVGLVDSTIFNGQRCEMRHVNPETGRAEVKLQDGAVKAVRQANLVRPGTPPSWFAEAERLEATRTVHAVLKRFGCDTSRSRVLRLAARTLEHLPPMASMADNIKGVLTEALYAHDGLRSDDTYKKLAVAARLHDVPLLVTVVDVQLAPAEELAKFLLQSPHALRGPVHAAVFERVVAIAKNRVGGTLDGPSLISSLLRTRGSERCVIHLATAQYRLRLRPPVTVGLTRAKMAAQRLESTLKDNRVSGVPSEELLFALAVPMLLNPELVMSQLTQVPSTVAALCELTRAQDANAASLALDLVALAAEHPRARWCFLNAGIEASLPPRSPLRVPAAMRAREALRVGSGDACEALSQLRSFAIDPRPLPLRQVGEALFSVQRGVAEANSALPFSRILLVLLDRLLPQLPKKGADPLEPPHLREAAVALVGSLSAALDERAEVMMLTSLCSQPRSDAEVGHMEEVQSGGENDEDADFKKMRNTVQSTLYLLMERPLDNVPRDVQMTIVRLTMQLLSIMTTYDCSFINRFRPAILTFALKRLCSLLAPRPGEANATLFVATTACASVARFVGFVTKDAPPAELAQLASSFQPLVDQLPVVTSVLLSSDHMRDAADSPYRHAASIATALRVPFPLTLVDVERVSDAPSLAALLSAPKGAFVGQLGDGLQLPLLLRASHLLRDGALTRSLVCETSLPGAIVAVLEGLERPLREATAAERLAAAALECVRTAGALRNPSVLGALAGAGVPTALEALLGRANDADSVEAARFLPLAYAAAVKLFTVAWLDAGTVERLAELAFFAAKTHLAHEPVVEQSLGLLDVLRQRRATFLPPGLRMGGYGRARGLLVEADAKGVPAYAHVRNFYASLLPANVTPPLLKSDLRDASITELPRFLRDGVPSDVQNEAARRVELLAGLPSPPGALANLLGLLLERAVDRALEPRKGDATLLSRTIVSALRDDVELSCGSDDCPHFAAPAVWLRLFYRVAAFNKTGSFDTLNAAAFLCTKMCLVTLLEAVRECEAAPDAFDVLKLALDAAEAHPSSVTFFLVGRLGAASTDTRARLFGLRASERLFSAAPPGLLKFACDESGLCVPLLLELPSEESLRKQLAQLARTDHPAILDMLRWPSTALPVGAQHLVVVQLAESMVGPSWTPTERALAQELLLPLTWEQLRSGTPPIVPFAMRLRALAATVSQFNAGDSALRDLLFETARAFSSGAPLELAKALLVLANSQNSRFDDLTALADVFSAVCGHAQDPDVAVRFVDLALLVKTSGAQKILLKRLGPRRQLLIAGAEALRSSGKVELAEKVADACNKLGIGLAFEDLLAAAEKLSPHLRLEHLRPFWVPPSELQGAKGEVADEGGFGEVKFGTLSRAPGDPVAFKMPKRGDAEELKTATTALLQEASILGELQHDGQLLQQAGRGAARNAWPWLPLRAISLTAERVPVMVIPRMDGDLNAALLKIGDDDDGAPPSPTAGARNVRAALKVCAWAARNLKLLHERGVLHGDIKPDNLLFFKNGEKFETTTLADFGCARRVAPRHAAPDHVELTDSSLLGCGTVAYWAPELFTAILDRCRPAPSAAADVFALGVTLAQLTLANPNGPYSAVPFGELLTSRDAAFKDPLSEENRVHVERWRNALQGDGGNARLMPSLPSDESVADEQQRRALKKVVEGCTRPDPKRRWQLVQVQEALWGALDVGTDDPTSPKMGLE
jgi:serine/threonine protein kinase